MFDDVAEFHTKVLGLTPPKEPTLLSQDMIYERYKFMREELAEYMEASDRENIEKTVDGLLDLIYVALGTIWMMGIPANEVWKFVQEANMKKVRGTTSRGNLIDAVKPEGWVGPEQQIREFIQKLADESRKAQGDQA